MKKQQLLYLENRETIKKLKQSCLILTDLRNQCNQLQSQLNLNPHEALEQAIRKLNLKKQKLNKQITILKRDIDTDDNPVYQTEEDKIKEMYDLHRQIEHKKSINIQKNKELEIIKNKINSNVDVNHNEIKKLEEMKEKFKSVEVSLGSQKAKEKYQELLERKGKNTKLIEKKNLAKQQQYNKKLKQLQSYGQKTNQHQGKQKQLQRKIDLLADVLKQLKIKTREKPQTRLKTQRATTENSVQYPSSKYIPKRYSSLQPAKDQNQINQFLQPWQSSSNLPIQKQFQVRQLNKRVMGQKIRVYLNN